MKSHAHACIFLPSFRPDYARCFQVRVKCNEDDTIGDLKKLVAAQVWHAWCVWEGGGSSAVHHP